MDPFLGEIRILPFTFAPVGWAQCDGQIVPIAQNTALFALLGTTYGGNGTTNFQLPDLRGRVPMDAGNGPGLTSRPLGSTGGATTVTLSSAHLPLHSHALQGSGALGTTGSPSGSLPAVITGRGSNLYTTATTPAATMRQTVGNAGGGLPHNNVQPWTPVLFCIALTGIFPPRT